MPDFIEPLDLALAVATAGVAYLEWEAKATAPRPRRRDPDPTGRPIARKLQETFRKQLAEIVRGLPDVPTAPLPARFDLTDWDKPLASAMTPLIRPYWDAGGKKLRAAVGLDPAEWRVTDPHLREKIETAAFDFAHSTNETTSLELTAAKDRLRAELAEGVVERGETTRELTARVKKVFSRASTYRAQRIAFTEAMRATNVSSLESAKQSGVCKSKRLLISSDACPLCHAVKDREPPGGWPLDEAMHDDGRGHPSYSISSCPPLHPGCNCTVTFEIDDESIGLVPEADTPQPEPEAIPAPEPEPEATPEPEPEPLPEYGPSQARIRHRDHELEEILEPVRELLGPDATLADVASLVGAPDDALVDVALLSSGEEIIVDVKGPGYQASRVLKREGGQLVITNHSFYVDRDRQGQGLGAEVFGRQVEQAARLGVARIETYAARGKDMNGYSTWPRFGYDGPLPKLVQVRIEKGIIPPPPVETERVGDLMLTPEGRAWWKTHGQGADLTFDLAEGSPNRLKWEAYRREKAGK